MSLYKYRGLLSKYLSLFTSLFFLFSFKNCTSDLNFGSQTVESFLYEQTVVNKVSTVDYLTSLVLNEIEFMEIKKDMTSLGSEIK